MPHRRKKHKLLLDQLTADEPLRRAPSPAGPLPEHSAAAAGDPISPRNSTASSLVRPQSSGPGSKIEHKNFQATLVP